MTEINLLPWRERRQARQRRRFVVGLIASLAGAGVVLAGTSMRLDARISAEQSRNAVLVERVGELDRRLAAVADQRHGNSDLEARIGMLQQLAAQRRDTVQIYDELAQVLVPGLRYTTLSRRSDVIALRGTADSQNSVSALMRNVERSRWFGPPSLQNISDGADGADGADSHGYDRRAVFDLTFNAVTVAADSSVETKGNMNSAP